MGSQARQIGGGDNSQIQILSEMVRDGHLTVHDGPHPSPTVALLMDADDYVKVVNGDMDGMRAFTSGRGKVKGSVRAAMKMRDLFPAA